MKNQIFKKVVSLFLVIAIAGTVASLPCLAVSDSAESVEIVEKHYYYADGTPIEDDALIAKLDATETIDARGALCCDNMNKTTAITEEHTYLPPLPTYCVYDVITIVVCSSCTAVWSRTHTGRYTHIHT